MNEYCDKCGWQVELVTYEKYRSTAKPPVTINDVSMYRCGSCQSHYMTPEQHMIMEEKTNDVMSRMLG